MALKPQDYEIKHERVYVQWVNKVLKSGPTHKFADISQLWDCQVYTNLITELFPEQIDVNAEDVPTLIKWKNLQQCFNSLGIDKKVDIRKLMVRDHDVHLDFVAWFREFYEMNRLGPHGELLRWVQVTSHIEVTSIADMFDAKIYCLMIRKLCPNSIDISQINFRPNTVEESKKNWTLFQLALKDLGYNNTKLPRTRLAGGEEWANLKVLAWFKKLHEKHVKREESVENADQMFKIIDVATVIQQIETKAQEKGLKEINRLKPIMDIKIEDDYLRYLFKIQKIAYDEIRHKLMNGLMNNEDPTSMTQAQTWSNTVKAMLQIIQSYGPNKPVELESVLKKCQEAAKNTLQNTIKVTLEKEDQIMRLKIRGEHPLKNVFYSMKEKYIRARDTAKSLQETEYVGGVTDVRPKNLWFALREASIMAGNIKDIVDFVHRGHRRR